MKKLLLILLTFMTHLVFANDTYFYMAGGNLLPTKENDISVEMKDETILLNLQENYYEVTVDFKFYNSGETLELEVGFPFFSEGIGGNGKIWDYKCWTNGSETAYIKTPLEKKWSTPNGLEYANVRKIKFPKNAYTTTRVQYKSEYGRIAPSSQTANYLYGTGLSWKGKIGKINLIIDNNILYSILYNVYMENRESIIKTFEKTKDNRYETTLFNIEPEKYEAVFEIELTDVLGDDGPKGFPAYFNFNKYIVDKDCFIWYSKEQLRLVRNAIYALHGYSFKSKDLQEYFNKVGRNWNPPYKENPNFSESDFSEIERTNINNLLEEEKRRDK